MQSCSTDIHLYTTFWDGLPTTQKRRHRRLTTLHVRQAFTIEQITEELAGSKSQFLIAEIDGEPAGLAKLIFDTTKPKVIGEWPVEFRD